MSRVFVRNLSDVLISEVKPGIGTFNIPAKDRIEIFDNKQKQKMPNGEEIEYVYTAVKVVADSIVRDRDRGDLAVEVEEASEEKKAREDKEKAAKETSDLNRKVDSDARIAKAEAEVTKAEAALVEAKAKLVAVKEEEVAREKEYQRQQKKLADDAKAVEKARVDALRAAGNPVKAEVNPESTPNKSEVNTLRNPDANPSGAEGRR